MWRAPWPDAPQGSSGAVPLRPGSPRRSGAREWLGAMKRSLWSNGAYNWRNFSIFRTRTTRVRRRVSSSVRRRWQRRWYRTRPPPPQRSRFCPAPLDRAPRPPPPRPRRAGRSVLRGARAREASATYRPRPGVKVADRTPSRGDGAWGLGPKVLRQGTLASSKVTPRENRVLCR